MRIGIFGGAQANSPRPGAVMGQGFHDFIDFNVEAEALGYHSTFLVEHHFSGWHQVSATLTLLTWLAARTRTLRLGTAVMVLPWHNPVILAEQAATLDLMSDGRLDFGVGKGYRYSEFKGFSVAVKRPMRALKRHWMSSCGRGLRNSVSRTAAAIGNSTISWSSRRRGSGRIHRSGWRPVACRRSVRWPRAISI
jgi:hypothetical protein